MFTTKCLGLASNTMILWVVFSGIIYFHFYMRIIAMLSSEARTCQLGEHIRVDTCWTQTRHRHGWTRVCFVYLFFIFGHGISVLDTSFSPVLPYVMLTCDIELAWSSHEGREMWNRGSLGISCWTWRIINVRGPWEFAKVWNLSMVAGVDSAEFASTGRTCRP